MNKLSAVVRITTSDNPNYLIDSDEETIYINGKKFDLVNYDPDDEPSPSCGYFLDVRIPIEGDTRIVVHYSKTMIISESGSDKFGAEGEIFGLECDLMNFFEFDITDDANRDLLKTINRRL